MRLGLGLGLGHRRGGGGAIESLGASLVDWWKSGTGLVDTAGLVDSWTGSVNGRILAGAGAGRWTRDTTDALDSPNGTGTSEQFMTLAGWSPPSFDHWVTFVAKPTATASAGWIAPTLAGVAQGYGFWDNSGTQWFTWINAATQRLQFARTANANRQAVSFVMGLTYCAVWVNGVLVREETYATASVSTPDGYKFGALDFGAGYDLQGPRHDIVLAQGIPTTAQVQAVHAQLTTLRGPFA